MRELKINGLYRHFKNKPYKVVGTAFDCETMREVVIYMALYGEYKTWIRDKEVFLSEVDREKYPDVKQKYRFEEITEIES